VALTVFGVNEVPLSAVALFLPQNDRSLPCFEQLSLSGWRNFFLERFVDCPTLHHKFDLTHRGDVVRRITLDGD